jgi:hypothetical protein
MAQENLDPHAEGYVFSPVNSVTGFFDSHDQLDPALQSLREAGFEDQDVGVFVGEEGAQTLDLSGQRHGFAVQLWRHVEAIFSDQTELHQLTDQTLRGGGIVIGVRTDGDVEKKATASRILKAHQAHQINFWGPLTVERLG